MKRKSRDKRVRRRAELREHRKNVAEAHKTVDDLSEALVQPVAFSLDDFTPEELEKVRELATLNPSEQAFNDKMAALGVPSFNQWFAKKGQAVIDKAAMQGKPGAFLLQSMMNPPKDVSEE